MLKYLDPVKAINLDDNATSALCTKAYNYYQTRSASVFSSEQTEQDNIVISSFVRFFKCMNSAKKVDEDMFNNYIEKEILKGKTNTINLIKGYINEIKGIQGTRLLYGVTDISDSLKCVPYKNNSKGLNIRKVINLVVTVAITQRYTVMICSFSVINDQLLYTL